jgi:hypothetical protein
MREECGDPREARQPAMSRESTPPDEEAMNMERRDTESTLLVGGGFICGKAK